jgi:hypothetical protein
MSNPKPQPKPQTKSTKPAAEKGALSDASLNKVTGGNMPTSVERSSGGGGGTGRG